VNEPSSPLRQARELLEILAFLFAVGCYFAQVYHVPFLDDALDGMSYLIYSWVPQLNQVKIPNAHEIVAAGASGLILLIVMLPFTRVIARQNVKDLESDMRSIQRKRQPRRAKIR